MTILLILMSDIYFYIYILPMGYSLYSEATNKKTSTRTQRKQKKLQR